MTSASRCRVYSRNGTNSGDSRDGFGGSTNNVWFQEINVELVVGAIGDDHGSRITKLHGLVQPIELAEWMQLDLGSEGAAKRLYREADSRSGGGIAITLASEAAMWEARLSSAQGDFNAIAPEYDEKKAVEIAAKAAVEAKKAEVKMDFEP